MTHEERKAKAIELLKKLDIYKPYIKGFVERNQVCFFERFGGYWVYQEPEVEKKMKEIEKKPEIPAMVHTDLRVVDGQLNEIHPSFMYLSGISGDRMETRQLLAQNVVTGCTMMVTSWSMAPFWLTCMNWSSPTM